MDYIQGKIKQNGHLWEYFTKAEEYRSSKLDKHGRFNYSMSCHKDVLEPRISKFLIKSNLNLNYPMGKKFAICLSHDVDDIYPTGIHSLLSIGHYFRKLDFEAITEHIGWRYFGKKTSPFMNFEEIINLEEQYGAKSTFFFLASKTDPIRPRYDVKDIKSELLYIIKKGWEIGLHGSYYAYNDLEQIKREKEKLESVVLQTVKGYRSHYLRFDTPFTWNLLAKAGFNYDTTFGYSDMVGFRNGMCHPFEPFDLEKEINIDILEIPLIIMDGALFKNVDSLKEAWVTVKKILDSVKDCSGVVTILWHNQSFACPYKEEWKEMYEKILQYGYQKNAWMTSGWEIYKWWKGEAY
ncbi:MAG: hypothetical protein FH756_07365 [Firmicutes bacterium]|nr:hypothetical protein [Bacillota bacterium]